MRPIPIARILDPRAKTASEVPQTKNSHVSSCFLHEMVEAAGIEKASTLTESGTYSRNKCLTDFRLVTRKHGRSQLQTSFPVGRQADSRRERWLVAHCVTREPSRPGHLNHLSGNIETAIINR